MIKAVIFDMDGTILNTLTDITLSVNYALNQKGLHKVSVDQVRMAVGNGAYRLIERLVPDTYTDEETLALFNIYQSYYDFHSDVHTGPYEGILELLTELKNTGIKLAVVSNKFEHLVQQLNISMFNKMFDCAIGEVKGIPIKPAPDMVYKALNLLKIHKEETLFVGDAEPDMMTAQNAGVTSVGVTWGFRTKDILKNHGAHYIIDHPKALIDVIKEVNYV